MSGLTRARSNCLRVVRLLRDLEYPDVGDARGFAYGAQGRACFYGLTDGLFPFGADAGTPRGCAAYLR